MSDRIYLDASCAIDGLQQTLDRFIANLGSELAERAERPTLRDRFALAALQGLLAEPCDDHMSHYCDRNCRTREEYAAEDAYKMADAMMVARAPKSQDTEPTNV